ncbi:MAG: hypothetical protein KDD43_10400 [Bdellovibrionales bacterium]|nr:hypothetical protein [Bdellovibrionales bacterium]
MSIKKKTTQIKSLEIRNKAPGSGVRYRLVVSVPSVGHGEKRNERVEGVEIRINDKYGFENPSGFWVLFGSKKYQHEGLTS